MPLERACHSNVTWQGRQLAELRRDEELLLPRDLVTNIVVIARPGRGASWRSCGGTRSYYCRGIWTTRRSAPSLRRSANGSRQEMAKPLLIISH
eukprot:1180829-Prorocentrum_minimum.AAC.2